MFSDLKQRAAFLGECAKVIDDEAQSQAGLSGIAIKRAYRTLRNARPGIVERNLDRWLDDFANVLMHETNADRISLVWMAIIEKETQKYRSNPMFGLYQVFSPQVLKSLARVVPKFQILMKKHVVTPARIEPICLDFN